MKKPWKHGETPWEHRKAQALGRNRYFKDYRLRICTVMRDYGKSDRDEAPDDSKKAH